jgi:hypothetical protein
MVANTYLGGTYSEIYLSIGQDADGMRRLFRQFSFAGGIPSHAAPETPGPRWSYARPASSRGFIAHNRESGAYTLTASDA